MTDSIQKILCPDDERMDFLPRFTGKHFLRYEQLDDDRRFAVECHGNYYAGEMSAEVASIGVNLYVQNAFAWEVDAERFSRAFHQLRDFAAEHPDGGGLPPLFRGKAKISPCVIL